MPTASRILSADEIKRGQFSEVQGNLLDAYTTQLEIFGQAGVVLSGLTENGGYEKSHLSNTIKPMADIAWAVTQLTSVQQSYLDNIYMGWLSGLDPFSDNAVLVKGKNCDKNQNSLIEQLLIKCNDILHKLQVYICNRLICQHNAVVK